MLSLYILGLRERGFPLNLDGVEDMANVRLAERGGRRVGKLWARRYIQRRPELQMLFYDAQEVQEASCNGSEGIGSWFRRVKSVKAKYKILDCNIYNVDTTAFTMGTICPDMVFTHANRARKCKVIQAGDREWATAIHCVCSDGWSLTPFLLLQETWPLRMVNDATGKPSGQTVRLTFNASEHHKTALKWIKHFEECTASRAKGAYRMLVLHGNNSLHSAAFDWYCLNHSIIPVNLPADSYQLVQPLDIGCFGPLKRAYDHEMNQFSKRNINHITDVELLVAFEAAYRASVTKDNVKGGF